MALPDYAGLTAGTAKVWASSGGDYLYTATSVANDAARQGGKGDLGASWAREHNVAYETKMTSAPSNGKFIEIYWCESTSATAGTDNPGNLSGADGSVSNPDEIKLQLTYLGALPLSNATGTGVQRKNFSLFPRTRYGFPVSVNKGGVAHSDTAADHKFVVTPIRDEISDT
jgi:hypothetical protein